MKKLLLAMAVGAGLAWLFDPDAGARRRASVRRTLDERGMTGPSPAASPVVEPATPLVVTGR